MGEARDRARMTEGSRTQAALKGRFARSQAELGGCQREATGQAVSKMGLAQLAPQ